MAMKKCSDGAWHTLGLLFARMHWHRCNISSDSLKRDICQFGGTTNNRFWSYVDSISGKAQQTRRKKAGTLAAKWIENCGSPLCVFLQKV
jgi:hypothetical protein